ncbi:MAG: PBP1A family penicillin-binding protein [Deltaproteobacteria bacterium]|nr:PBP1A family penicillin-binding protein [Deltaproteobacteria bacterium]
MKGVIKYISVFFILIFFILAGTAGYFWYIWSSNMPYVGAIKDYQMPTVTEVFSSDGQVIGRFWKERRIIVPIDRMPRHLILAFVAVEDARFFEHNGVDIKGIIRAFFKNIFAGGIRQGGSTITQQVTRAILLKNKKRTYRRKVREIVLSLQLEKELSKNQILYLYLNQIYLGEGAYGVEAAARTYFHKSVEDLDIAESAMLAALPQAPTRYSPLLHFDRAKDRQLYVLKRMREDGFITDREFRKAVKEPLNIQAQREHTFINTPWFTEYIRQYLVKKYGKGLVYQGGLKVYTTVDLKMQEYAKAAVQRGLLELDKREGYRGPLMHLSSDEATKFVNRAKGKFKGHSLVIGSVVKALVQRIDDRKRQVDVLIGGLLCRLPLCNMKWARKPDIEKVYYLVRVHRPSEVLKKGDVILVRILKKDISPYRYEVSLEQDPKVQGALLCMSPVTGYVKAMIGGRDFFKSQFNRAIQSRRQPGSAFKPIIYSAALDKGMTPATVIMDSPIIFSVNSKGDEWKPKNYKEKFFGPTLLRTALAESRNIITIKILRKIGIDYVINYARVMGIKSPLSRNFSLALGSSGLSLLELVRSYAVFANGGNLPQAIFVKRIVDRKGEIIEENRPDLQNVISEQTAFVMTDMLKAVIQEGTAWRIKALKRPAAGKTGTTNNLLDAWFMGYTPSLVAGVWVGYDDYKAMGKGETGSRAASPIWLYFMQKVLKDKPVVDFHVPKGIVFVKIDADTGLLASPYSTNTVVQAFREGNEPKEYTPKPRTARPSDFFEFDMDNR